MRRAPDPVPASRRSTSPLLRSVAMKTLPTHVPGRDPWFDNARWLAGSLVVMVHANSDLMGGGGLADWLHAAFQPARIPLFALLVGLFTPRRPTSRDQNNLISMVIVPFTLVSAAHIALNWWWGIRPLFHPTSAQYTLWFMYGVIVWRLFGPLLARCRHFMVIAILISLASGAFEALTPFALPRVLGYTPFFALGLFLQQNSDWLRRRTRWSVAMAIAAIALWWTAVTVTLRMGIYRFNFVGMVDGYDTVGGNLTGMILRLVVLLMTGAAMLGFLHLMPRRRIRWLSYIGAGGFTIYMLHGLVLRLLRNWDFLPFFAEREWWAVVVTTAFAFALAAVLGSRPVRRATRFITRPQLRWLLLPADTEAHKPRSHATPTARGDEPAEGDSR